MNIGSWIGRGNTPAEAEVGVYKRWEVNGEWSGQVEESDTGDSSESETDESEGFNEMGDIHPILGELVVNKIPIFNLSDNIYVERRITSSRRFVNNVPHYEFNRIEDNEHIKHLKESLDVDRPYFPDTFSVGVIEETDEIKLMDGHHRHGALSEKISEDGDFNMPILVDVYNVPNMDVFRKLFKKINNKRNINPEDIPEEAIAEIVQLLTTRFPDAIRNKPEGRVNRPRINKRELVKSFHEFYKPQRYIEPREVFEKIKRINKDIGRMSHKELFGRTNPSDKKIKQFDKAKGFYLNLHSKYPPEKWIPMIYE